MMAALSIAGPGAESFVEIDEGGIEFVERALVEDELFHVNLSASIFLGSSTGAADAGSSQWKVSLEEDVHGDIVVIAGVVGIGDASRRLFIGGPDRLRCSSIVTACRRSFLRTMPRRALPS